MGRTSAKKRKQITAHLSVFLSEFSAKAVKGMPHEVVIIILFNSTVLNFYQAWPVSVKQTNIKHMHRLIYHDGRRCERLCVYVFFLTSNHILSTVSVGLVIE